VCPFCKQSFSPEFTVYSEFSGIYGLNGRKGKTFKFLSPIIVYKEFTTVIKSESPEVVLKEVFLKEHAILFWNMFLYFKIMKLPFFILDQDFTPKHVAVQVSWINKYLPLEKTKKRGSGLDSSKLMKLAEASPIRILRSRANSIASSDNNSQKDGKSTNKHETAELPINPMKPPSIISENQRISA